MRAATRPLSSSRLKRLSGKSIERYAVRAEISHDAHQLFGPWLRRYAKLRLARQHALQPQLEGFIDAPRIVLARARTPVRFFLHALGQLFEIVFEVRIARPGRRPPRG